jgi:hypothetical protein
MRNSARQSRYGESYVTPKTPQLKALINPKGGRLNCVACAIATDSTMAGNPASAIEGGPFPVSNIVRYSGRQGVDGKLTGIIQRMRIAGPGARAIVVGWREKPDQWGAQGHAFNVINYNGLVVFLDGQGGLADPVDNFVNYTLWRTR